MQTIELRGEKFESKYEDEKVIEVLRENVDSDFAKSLYSQYKKYGDLSGNQWAWVHKLVYDWENPKKIVTALDEVNLLPIFELFDSATENKLKYPKIRFELEGLKLVFSLAGRRAKYPGSLNISDGGPFHDNIWYGRIVREDGDAKLFPSYKMTQDVLDLIVEFADNPAELAAAYGIKTGRCCFCNKELSTDESLAVGYGPVCAKKFGLNWGEK